ncbi:MAG TPA: rRNA methyltransferase, partial [Cyclobacteriaceae bacterium]|nr:rRNA methyltransferase [Cyclobacteriaceae bacterium]
VIRKKSATQGLSLKARKGLTSPVKKIEDQLNTWTILPDPDFFTWNETVYAIPGSLHRETAFLLDHLKFVQAGTALATIKHDKLIPEHAAALSVDLNKANFSQIEVSEEDALRYLRKEPMHVQSSGRGYALVIFKGLPLGWVNMLDSRMNNLYPKEWRIRMAG